MLVVLRFASLTADTFTDIVVLCIFFAALILVDRAYRIAYRRADHAHALPMSSRAGYVG